MSLLRSRATATVSAFVLLVGAPAHASTPIVGDAALAAIAATTASSLLSIGQLVTQGQQALETAALISGTLRSASDVVVDLAYLSQNPDQIFDQAQQSFAISFPEIEAIARDAEAINANARSLNAPPARTVLDLIAHARSTEGNAYQAVMSFNNLTYGMLDPYLKQLKLLEKTTEEAGALRLEAKGPIDSKTASVITAKATANMANTLNSIAASNLEIARIKQQEYLEKQQAAAEAKMRSQHLGTSTPGVLFSTSDSLSSDDF